MSGFYEMAMLSGVSMVVAMSWALLVPFVIMYVLGEMQARRTGTREAHLGPKVLLGLLITVGFQVGVAGLAILVASIVESKMGDGATKTGAALLVAGALITTYPASTYYLRIGPQGQSRVGRQSLGFNAVLTGMVFASSGTLTSVLAFHSEDIAAPGAICLVYLIATVLLVSRLMRNPLPTASISREP